MTPKDATQESPNQTRFTRSCVCPNHAAREEGVIEFYTQFGLNERQIDIIASATPKQHYYLVQPEGRRLFDLVLGPVELSFLGVSGKEDLRRVRECAARFGADWPAHWLNQRGL